MHSWYHGNPFSLHFSTMYVCIYFFLREVLSADIVLILHSVVHRLRITPMSTQWPYT